MDLFDYKPEKPFSQKHLVWLKDYTQDEILQIISLGLKLKKEFKEGKPNRTLEGKTLAMVFSKSSTRTRVSFEVGMYQLGGMALFLSASDIQLGRGETIADTARVLSRMVDGIMIRTFKQSDVDELAEYAAVPVINGLTDLVHPCQALADIMTLYEQKGGLQGLKLAYMGDGNNVANSLLTICSKLGVNISMACPKGYEPDDGMIDRAKAFAARSGSSVILTHEPEAAVQGADAVYTDVWASMGEESETEVRKRFFIPYQVNGALFSLAKPDAIFLHCLPCHRDEEVTADVVDGPASAVIDEAENRLHVQKAVLCLLMGGGR
ncbi:MAG: ornithine carbamoyltransferase [Bacillota bacterium]|nr:ornithine carbamoyltransferase [Bacillota bacterium]